MRLWTTSAIHARKLARLLAAALFTICWAHIVEAADLTVAWDPSSDGSAIGYILLYGTGPGAYSQQIDVGDTTSYTIHGLSDGVTYYLTVRAYDATGGLSDPADEVSAMPRGDAHDINGAALAPSVGSPQLIGTRVTWTASATGGVEPYEYQWAIYHAGGWTMSAWSHASTWTWTPSTAGDDYLVRVAVRSAGSSSATGESSWSVPYRVTPPPVAPTSFWGDAPPALSGSVASVSSVELGVKFRSDVAGYVTGVRYYKTTGNAGTHTAHLWTATGTLLASATFVAGSEKGWQQVLFSSPVAISAATTYVASYSSEGGGYAYTSDAFTSGGDAPPLHALPSGVDGANGEYVYGSGFPVNSWRDTNYWVDVLFARSRTDTTAPGVTIWGDAVPPLTDLQESGAAVELGVKFHSDAAGYITGVRFYKTPGNTGTHTAHLWTSTGTLLASGTFTSETAAGWQQVLFASPVPITAESTYVASYFSARGGYAYTVDNLWTGTDAAPLHVEASGVGKGSGVLFPVSTWHNTNYWVDVLFTGTLHQ